DEGGYPTSLLGYAEYGFVDGGGVCHPETSTGVPYDGVGPCIASLDRLVNGFLYTEQVKDSGVFRCPDNVRANKLNVTIAHFPPRPTNWPIDPVTSLPYPYVTDPVNAAQFPDAPVNVC